MDTLLSAQEIHDQLQKIIQYYVFDESAELKINNIVSKISDTENVDEYAQKYEKDTDDFIHRLSELFELERKDTLSVVSETPDQVLMTFTIRVLTISEQLLKSPKNMLPISLDNAPLFCDCLIKYWRAYQKYGEINLLNTST